MEKVVNGATYEIVPSKATCVGCAGYNDGGYGDLCESLAEPNCCWKYVFVYKGVKAVPKETPTEGVKTDTGKPRYSLIPAFALEQVAICLTEGLKTHPAKDNWKLVKNAKERFIDSMYRHAEQHRMGEVFDRDNSNVRNLSAVIVNALFALEFEVNPSLNMGVLK